MAVKASIQPTMWTYTVMVAVLIIMVISLRPLNAAIESSQRGYLQAKADELASIINSVKNSPSETFFYDTPVRRTCTIEVNSIYVRINDGNDDVFSYMIQTEEDVERTEVSCSAARRVRVEKRGNVVTINGV